MSDTYRLNCQTPVKNGVALKVHAMSSQRDEIVMSRAEVRAFLNDSLTAVLTTMDVRGWPHSVAMWFLPRVVDGSDEIHMWTYAKSQKARNLSRDPRCAVLIEEGHRYAELRGVLVRAEARLLSDYDDVYRIGADLYDRYVFPHTGVPIDQGPADGIEKQAHKRVGVVVPLERVASWDHRKLAQ